MDTFYSHLMDRKEHWRLFFKIAAISVKGQICDGPIAKKSFLAHALAVFQISCLYHQKHNCCTYLLDYDAIHFLAHLTMWSTSLLYFLLLTPITNIGASADGALIITFLAPALICALAFSIVVNTPVDSTTYSAPISPHGIADGSFLIS